MISERSVIAIITARGGSKGLPRKNVLDLCGKPLVAWPVEAARRSVHVDRVIVSTDDPEIAARAKTAGAEIPFLRPAELASDTAKSISVIKHAIGYLEGKGERYDYCVLLEPTSPLTESDDVDRALWHLDSHRDIADSIVGVSRVVNCHPVYDVRIGEKGLIHPYARKDFSTPIRRQEIEDIYFFDGSLYISDTDVLLAKRGFYHERTLPFVMPKWKSFEVDDLADFLCVEAIMKNRARIEGEGS
jgi:CMP-N,N'-diacetyllegionaminic acid synthase